MQVFQGTEETEENVAVLLFRSVVYEDGRCMFLNDLECLYWLPLLFCLIQSFILDISLLDQLIVSEV